MVIFNHVFKGIPVISCTVACLFSVLHPFIPSRYHHCDILVHPRQRSGSEGTGAWHHHLLFFFFWLFFHVMKSGAISKNLERRTAREGAKR